VSAPAGNPKAKEGTGGVSNGDVRVALRVLGYPDRTRRDPGVERRG
jgi:hypothetical protein